MATTNFRLRWLLVLAVTCAVLTTGGASGDSHDKYTYPEEVHRLVVARLRERAGGGGIRGREGSWGVWAPWSPCSRSCGGGVATQARECIPSKRTRSSSSGGNRLDGARRAAGSKRCVGRYKRFQLCNTKVCHGPLQDFRRQQCENFNRTPFNGRTYSWEPYYESLTSCALNCRAIGLSFYATLNQTVIDGTPCGAQQYIPLHTPNQHRDVCVTGKCMTVGCDGILGSGHRWDQCGVCAGDNSTCRVVEGVYSKRDLPYGYSLVLTLPTGAANITLLHTAPTVNHLALRVPGGEYLIQGGRLPNGTLVNQLQAAGATFGYSKPTNYIGDSLTARGPLMHPLDVMIYFETPNPGIQYRYELPAGDTSPPPVPYPHHNQHLLDNPLNPYVPGGPASRTSINGVPPRSSSSRVSFKRLPLSGPVNDARSGGYVSDNLVTEREKEREKKKQEKEKKAHKSKSRRREQDNRRRKQHMKRGPYEWKVAGFTPCSKTCGGGVQATHVTCVRKRRSTEVPEQNCYAVPRPSPQTVRCNLKPCPPRWGAEEWSECSVSCGMGVQTRRLSCRQTVADDADIVLPDSACNDPATISRAQVCDRVSCDSRPQWHVGDWGDCSTRCGLGTRNRRVTCMAGATNIPHNHCAQPRPSDQQICDMGSCATNTWFFSTWEDQCSTDCGTGHERRRVHCNADPLDEKPNCDVGNRPNDTRACNSDRGCGGQWFAGEWSSCDAKCGGSGQQHREVICVSWGRRRFRIARDEAHCRSNPKPENLKVCSKPCDPQWFTSHWSQCSTTCGGGVQRREVKCLDDQQRPSLQCASASKLDTRQTCNTQRCQADRLHSHTILEDPTRLQNLNDEDPGTSRNRGSHYNVRADEPTAATSLEDDQDVEFKDGDGNDVALAAASQPRPAVVSAPSGWCMDRMKNCNLVYKARLCRLKYYSKLCCRTCAPEG